MLINCGLISRNWYIYELLQRDINVFITDNAQTIFVDKKLNHFPRLIIFVPVTISFPLI